MSRVRVLARVRPAFTEEEAVLATSLTDSTVTVRELVANGHAIVIQGLLRSLVHGSDVTKQ